MARISLEPPRTPLLRLGKWYSRRTYGQVLDPGTAWPDELLARLGGGGLRRAHCRRGRGEPALPSEQRLRPDQSGVRRPVRSRAGTTDVFEEHRRLLFGIAYRCWVASPMPSPAPTSRLAGHGSTLRRTCAGGPCVRSRARKVVRWILGVLSQQDGAAHVVPVGVNGRPAW